MGPSAETRSAQRISRPTDLRATRRRRGEPRRLLLEAAQELFGQKGFDSTSTREIAELAGVSEPLLFRQFGSKAGLFREALVGPFLQFAEEFSSRWHTEALDHDKLTRQLIGELYDLFDFHRGLVLTIIGADASEIDEFTDNGVYDDIERGMRTLESIGVGTEVRGSKSRIPCSS